MNRYIWLTSLVIAVITSTSNAKLTESHADIQDEVDVDVAIKTTKKLEIVSVSNATEPASNSTTDDIKAIVSVANHGDQAKTAEESKTAASTPDVMFAETLVRLGSKVVALSKDSIDHQQTENLPGSHADQAALVQVDSSTSSPHSFSGELSVSIRTNHSVNDLNDSADVNLTHITEFKRGLSALILRNSSWTHLSNFTEPNNTEPGVSVSVLARIHAPSVANRTNVAGIIEPQCPSTHFRGELSALVSLNLTGPSEANRTIFEQASNTSATPINSSEPRLIASVFFQVHEPSIVNETKPARTESNETQRFNGQLSAIVRKNASLALKPTEPAIAIRTHTTPNVDSSMTSTAQGNEFKAEMSVSLTTKPSIIVPDDSVVSDTNSSRIQHEPGLFASVSVSIQEPSTVNRTNTMDHEFGAELSASIQTTTSSLFNTFNGSTEEPEIFASIQLKRTASSTTATILATENSTTVISAEDSSAPLTTGVPLMGRMILPTPDTEWAASQKLPAEFEEKLSKPTKSSSTTWMEQLLTTSTKSTSTFSSQSPQAETSQQTALSTEIEVWLNWLQHVTTTTKPTAEPTPTSSTTQAELNSSSPSEKNLMSLSPSSGIAASISKPIRVIYESSTSTSTVESTTTTVIERVTSPAPIAVTKQSTTMSEIINIASHQVSTASTPLHSDNVSFKCPQADGLFPNSDLCEFFWHCSSSIAYLKQCPGTLVFNPEASICDYKSPSCADRRVLRTSDRFKCQEDGLFANKRDCHKFYQCSNGLALEHKCPSDLYFSQATLRCERSALVCIFNK